MMRHTLFLAMPALLAAVSLLAAADEKQSAAAKKALQQTAGTWRIVSLERNGEKVAAAELQERTVTTTADGHFTVHQGAKVVGQGTVKLDPTKEPKTIDATYTESDHPELKGKTAQGIYEVEGGNLKVCYAHPGAPRPKDFSAEKGSGHVLIVYEREKAR